jgi:spore maturation protein CgeB
MFDVFSFKENENIEKSNPDRAHGLFISLASKRNTWCNIDEFVPTICF